MIKQYLTRSKKALLFSTMFLSWAGFSNAQTTGTETFSATGADDSPTTITINTSNLTVNQGQNIQSITISNFFGGDLYGDEYDCGDWYEFTLSVDGSDVVTGCSGDIIGYDVTGASVIAVYSGDLDGYSDDVKIEVELEVTFDTPSCFAPTAGVVDAVTIASADVSWTGGSESSWNVTWGLVGFTAGNELGSQTVATPSIQISGLSDNTIYEIRVVADCGAGDLSYPLTFTARTTCDAIDAIGFCESFEQDSPALACWAILDNDGNGYYDQDYDYYEDQWYFSDDYASDGSYSAEIYFSGNGGDDYLISPNLTLTGNEVMTFKYNSYDPNFKVLLSTTGTDPADFTEELFVYNGGYTDDFVDTAVNLSAYQGTVYIAFYSDYVDWGTLQLDEICIDVCIPNPGTDGSANVCNLDGTFDLNPVITSDYSNGTWYFPANPGIISNSDLNVSTLAAGSYDLIYVVKTACTSDTTHATINIYNQSHAGNNGVINACKNQLVDLYGGLSGVVNFGGTWYDPNGTPIASPYFQTGTLAGQFIYKYIVSNGVCDADTSEILLDVASCDFLGLEDAILENVSLHPNPSNGQFQISGIPANAGFTFEVLDLNGRIIRSSVQIQSSATAVDLSTVDNGIYMVRISGNESEKIIRVVKQ